MNTRWIFALLILLCALALAFALGACGKDGDDPRTAPAETDDDTDDPGANDDDTSSHWPDDDEDDDDDDDDDDADDDAEPTDDPANSGAFEVGVKNLTFDDPGSGQEQELTLAYPSDDGGTSVDLSQGMLPPVIFGPGSSLRPDLYMSHARHLASWGYVVVLRDNYTISHMKLKATTTGIIDWLQVQTNADKGLLSGAIDMSNVGAAGHALGGKISLLTAYHDYRVMAVGTLDPVDSNPALAFPPSDYPSVTPELMSFLEKPTLFVGAQSAGDCAPQDENYQQYYEFATSPAVEITILGAGHMSFLDNPNCGIPCLACPSGTADHELVKELSRRYLTAFFNVHLKDKEDYEYWITGGGIISDQLDGLITARDK